MKRYNELSLVSCLAILVLVAMAAQTIAAVEKGPYLIYPGNNTQMTVLWQLSSSSSNELRWGQDTNYSDGSNTPSRYGDNQYKYTITGLTPGTLYYYDIENVGSGTFNTAPADDATHVKFLAFGDTRSNTGPHNAVNAAMIDAYTSDPAYQTFTMLSGDWVNNGESESQWTDQFFSRSLSHVMEMHANLPTNGCIGNHEGNGTLYDKYWPYPYESGGRYWSFDYGPAHVVVLVLTSEPSGTLGGAQKAWLEADLAASTKEWKFLQFHAPVYSAGKHVNNTAEQSYIQNLCKNYNVDIVFNGHNHYYSHCDVDGVKHITTGGGGAPLNPTDINYHPSIKVVSSSNHFCKIDIQDKALYFEAVRSNGTSIDEFTLSHINDTTAPTPDPMTWASEPAAAGSSSVTMTASTATDDNFAVQYYFECTVGNGHNSGWQDSPTYVDKRLVPSSQYTYRVKARDRSSNYNETGWSSEMVGQTDLKFPDPGDFNGDGFVNLLDFGLLGLQWSKNDCDTSDFWCNFTDMDLSTGVDTADLAEFTSYWLEEYELGDSEMLAFDDFDSYPIGRSVFSLSNWYTAGYAEVSANGIGGSQGCTPDPEFFVWSAGDGSINEFNWAIDQAIGNAPVLVAGDSLVFSMDFEFTEGGFVQESVGFTIFPTWFYNYYYSIWDLSFTISLSDWPLGGYGLKGAWSTDWGKNTTLAIAPLPDPTVGTWYQLSAAFTKIEGEGDITEPEDPNGVPDDLAGASIPQVQADPIEDPNDGTPMVADPALSINIEVWQLDENGKREILFGEASIADTSMLNFHRPNTAYFNPNFGLWPIFRNVSPGGCDNAYFGYIPAEVVVVEDEGGGDD